jgi:hypothetical protein
MAGDVGEPHRAPVTVTVTGLVEPSVAGMSAPLDEVGPGPPGYVVFPRSSELRDVPYVAGRRRQEIRARR